MMDTKQIWDLYSDDLYRFIKSKVRHLDITDDLLQETFIKIHANNETLRDESKLKSWCFSVARYTVIDYFRKQGKAVAFEENDIQDVDSEPVPAHTEVDCLHGILKTLPDKYRTPLFLSDIKGLKQSQVAEKLDLPLPTVKSQIQRARKLITQGYMDCCDFSMNEKGQLVGEIKDKEACIVCS
ncbi:sigma-70 family RNA polymerase sigma factor [Mangrovimonas aestuarii]|uniref:sigma-70 family RNA polymerase sigma factor n=1 Tax=Mangrovimonas aestuarii TaxID=3018443 RepID=UPI0029E80EFE|nr:sigma-70 family RNA polymerase sigma factor [Mangrovimonas aestuarii]